MGSLLCTAANEVEKCKEFSKNIEKNIGAIHYYDIWRWQQSNNIQYPLFLEGNEIVFLSKDYNGISSTDNATQCNICDLIRTSVYRNLYYAKLVGYNYYIMLRNVNLKHIVCHLFSAERRLRDNTTIILCQQKLIVKQQFQINMLKDLLPCNAESKFGKGVIQVFWKQMMFLLNTKIRIKMMTLKKKQPESTMGDWVRTFD